jgi:hypothetical protein
MNAFKHKSVLIYLLLFSCTAGKKIASCDKETVTAISDKLVKKAGFKLSALKREVTENDSCYQVSYSPVQLNVRGGGAEIKILKKDCKVIEGKLYQ